MAKRKKIIFLLFILLSCQDKDKNLGSVSLKNIDYEYVNERSSCTEPIHSIGITPSLMNKFIKKVKDKYSNDKFERVVLMFYRKDGEVIEFHQFNILFKDKNNVIVEAHIDPNVDVLKKRGEINLYSFYEYLSNAQDKAHLLNNELLIIDIDSKHIKCSSYFNIKHKIINEIIDLSFVKKIGNF